jgi:hypothetical protein
MAGSSFEMLASEKVPYLSILTLPNEVGVDRDARHVSTMDTEVVSQLVLRDRIDCGFSRGCDRNAKGLLTPLRASCVTKITLRSISRIS